MHLSDRRRLIPELPQVCGQGVVPAHHLGGLADISHPVGSHVFAGHDAHPGRDADRAVSIRRCKGDAFAREDVEVGRPHKAGSCVACGVKPLLIRRDEENAGLLCHEISSCSMRGAKSQLSERYLRVFSFPPFAPSMRKICRDLHWCRRLPTKRVSTEGKAGGLNNSWHRKRFLSSRRQKCEVITCMSAIQL